MKEGRAFGPTHMYLGYSYTKLEVDMGTTISKTSDRSINLVAHE
jgi:hypothetical protein